MTITHRRRAGFWTILLLLVSLVFLLAGCSATSLLSAVRQQVAAEKAANAAKPRVATPTISPGTGTYSNDQSVSITNMTSGATVYYTVANGTNGTTPTTSSSTYTSPIAVLGNGRTETIEAFAVKDGMRDSDVAVATVGINYSVVSTPYFSPSAGTFPKDQKVAIADVTGGASIYYTTDGSTPSASHGTLYTGPVPVSGDGTTATFQAIAVKSGKSPSNISTSSYTIDYGSLWAPVFTPTAGTYSTDQSVSISDQSSGATIHYTTDGSTPTAASSVYSSPIPVTGDGASVTVKAVATESGHKDSQVSAATYAINYAAVSIPNFDPAPGVYVGGLNVTISCATSGVTIYYTTDGSLPTTSSTVYTGPIHISSLLGTTTIRAVAVKSGGGSSQPAKGAYTIVAGL